MHDHLAAPLEFGQPRRQLVERNQHGPRNAADLEFPRLAHVEQQERILAVEPRLQLLDRRLIRRRRLRDRRGRRDAAELFVIDEFGHGGMVAADRALCVLPYFQLAEPHLQRIEEQESPDQRFTGAQNRLDRLGRLDRANHARQDAQNTAFGATRHEPRRRRIGKHAPIARTAGRREHRHLPFEPEDAAVDIRLP